MINEWIRSISGRERTGKSRTTWRETCYSATLSTKNPTRSGVGLKPRLHAEKLATNSQSHKLHLSVTLDGIIRVAVAQSVQRLSRGMTVRRLNSDRGKRRFSFPEPFDWPWGPPTLLLNECQGSLPEADHSPPSSAQVNNPLTPELNPSAQRCLPRFFTGDFNF
jgi:hypothetical protein